MIIWCIILFGLGIIAFLDTIFNYGDIFRRVNSVVFMLISLGLLVRISSMARLREKESLKEINERLKNQATNKISAGAAVNDNQPATAN